MGELFYQSESGEWRKIGNATLDDAVTTEYDSSADVYLCFGDGFEFTADLVFDHTANKEHGASRRRKEKR